MGISEAARRPSGSAATAPAKSPRSRTTGYFSCGSFALFVTQRLDRVEARGFERRQESADEPDEHQECRRDGDELQ